MKIKIGLRTVKTAVCAALGILLAQQLGLLYPASAGIITILSVTNTKRSSFETGFYRICSLGLATGIAFICFKVIGFNAAAFGIYLLLFIPLAVSGKMSEGIPVSSVLVTHYLVEKSLDYRLIGNAFCLLFIGVGLALLANSYMPDISHNLQKSQKKIDEKIRQLLLGMSHYLAQDGEAISCGPLLSQVVVALAEAEETAQRHGDNQLLTSDDYYFNYFTMRRLQVNVLGKMNDLVNRIDYQHGNTEQMRALLTFSAVTFAEENDGLEIRKRIEETLSYYRDAPLPKTREEFENRARLYQLLNEFERFIEIKIDYTIKNRKKKLSWD